MSQRFGTVERQSIRKRDGVNPEVESQEISLLREIGKNRAINRFYRTCYAILQQNRQHVADIASALTLLSCAPYSDNEGGASVILEMARKLKFLAEHAGKLEEVALQALENIESIE